MSICCARVFLLAMCLSLGLSGTAKAKNWIARNRLYWGELTDWTAGEAKGYRLIYLNGNDVAGSPRYTAVAVKNEKQLEWYWLVGSLEFVQ